MERNRNLQTNLYKTHKKNQIYGGKQYEKE